MATVAELIASNKAFYTEQMALASRMANLGLTDLADSIRESTRECTKKCDMVIDRQIAFESAHRVGCVC